MRKLLFCASVLPFLAAIAHAQYGDGSDGPLVVTSSTRFEDVIPGGFPCDQLSAGTARVTTTWSHGLQAGMEVLVTDGVHGPQSSGRYDLVTIVAVESHPIGPFPGMYSSTIDFEPPLANSYDGKPYFQHVPHYTDVTVAPGAELFGRCILFRASGTVDIQGSIAGVMYFMYPYTEFNGLQGESPVGRRNTYILATPNGGGGGAGTPATIPAGGGGGSYATSGTAGGDGDEGGVPAAGGQGGNLYGSADLSDGLFAGSSGGGGAALPVLPSRTIILPQPGFAGIGGGIVRILAPAISISGTIGVDGTDGIAGSGDASDPAGGGGGGSAGTIWLVADALSGNGTLSALGGVGGAAGTGDVTTGAGGNGGHGRIRIDTPSASAGSLALHGGTLHFGSSTTSAVDDWTMY